MSADYLAVYSAEPMAESLAVQLVDGKAARLVARRDLQLVGWTAVSTADQKVGLLAVMKAVSMAAGRAAKKAASKAEQTVEHLVAWKAVLKAVRKAGQKVVWTVDPMAVE